MYSGQIKLRHEIKHTINLSDYYTLRARLRAVAKHDKNAGPDGKYKIRSLYFENIFDKALREKVDGVNVREKFRIRYYNDDPSFIRLEKKSKINGLCNKLSTVVTKKQCLSIINGNLEWMVKSEDPLLVELYSKMHYQLLKPKVIVDYEREAFIYPAGNVRVTLDSNIRTGLFSKDFFNKDLPSISTTPSGIAVLEVKYDQFIPDFITTILQLNNRRAGAFSKYEASRIYE